MINMMRVADVVVFEVSVKIGDLRLQNEREKGGWRKKD